MVVIVFFAEADDMRRTSALMSCEDEAAAERRLIAEGFRKVEEPAWSRRWTRGSGPTAAHAEIEKVVAPAKSHLAFDYAYERSPETRRKRRALARESRQRMRPILAKIRDAAKRAPRVDVIRPKPEEG